MLSVWNISTNTKPKSLKSIMDEDETTEFIITMFDYDNNLISNQDKFINYTQPIYYDPFIYFSPYNFNPFRWFRNLKLPIDIYYVIEKFLDKSDLDNLIIALLPNSLKDDIDEDEDEEFYIIDEDYDFESDVITSFDYDPLLYEEIDTGQLI